MIVMIIIIIQIEGGTPLGVDFCEQIPKNLNKLFRTFWGSDHAPMARFDSTCVSELLENLLRWFYNGGWLVGWLVA